MSSSCSPVPKALDTPLLPHHPHEPLHQFHQQELLLCDKSHLTRDLPQWGQGKVQPLEKNFFRARSHEKISTCLIEAWYAARAHFNVALVLIYVAWGW